jgi:hypothetical protein
MSILSRLLEHPPLTPQRVRFAYAVAVTTDLLQLLLGPFGWAFIDELLDVAAMAAITRAIGFHIALLPTFMIELLPVSDFLPTWTASVAMVVALRRRKQVLTPAR